MGKDTSSSPLTMTHPKPSKVKYKKAPQAPRRFKSAYMFYSTWKHPDIRENLLKDQKNVKTPEVAKMVSRSWNQLTPEERAPWEEMARKDKARFELEKSMYSGPWKVPNVKDPKAPKRPVSAFLCFSKERRAQVKRQGPHMTTTQISAVLARMWKEAPEEERQKYFDLDTKDRERYRRELEVYNEIASQGRKKREELAFQAIAEKPRDAKRFLSPKQAERNNDMSDDSLMNELMNQPLMIDVQDIEEFSSACSTPEISLDSGLNEMESLPTDMGGDGRLLAYTPPVEQRVENRQFGTAGDARLYWEPLPLAAAPLDDAPVSPERSSPRSSIFPRPAVVTPPKLEVQPKELVDNESIATPGYEVSQPDSIFSRSLSAPLPMTHPPRSPWYSPRSTGLVPRAHQDVSCFGDHFQGYDTFPYHQIPRRSSWEPTYHSTAIGSVSASAQPQEPRRRHASYSAYTSQHARHQGP